MNSSTSNSEALTNSTKTHRELLLQPYTHISQVPLPEVWKKLGEAFNSWLNIPEVNLQELEKIIEMYQYSNLLLDDIENSRDFRDGLPSAYSVYGLAHNITAYIYIIINSGSKLHVLNEKFDKLYEELLKKTCLAQSTQSFWSKTVSCPTETEYYDMIIQKTFLTTKIKLMQIWSSCQKNFVKLCGIFALYFHILDDYHRLTSIEDSNPSYLEDITLGRFSLPIIHAIKTQPREGAVILGIGLYRIEDILRLRTKDVDLKKYCVSLLERFGSFAYTKTILEHLKHEVLKEIKQFRNNSLMETFIEDHMDSSVILINTDFNIHQPSILTSYNNISLYVAQMDQPQSQDKIDSKIEQLLRPLRHLDSISGKNIRDGFAKILNKWLNVSEEKIAVIKHIVNYFHAGSLLLDDIQDDSDLRRGLPVAHRIFGIGNTINTAIYMFALSTQQVLSLECPKAMDVFIESSKSIIRGQGMDVYWRDSCVCPTEAEYLDMVLGKTGAPFLLIGNLLELFSLTKKNPARLMSTIGQFFQINDDYQNLTNQVFFDSKGFCEDLTEGKFGFPVVHAINSHPKEGQIIMEVLRKKTNDVEMKKMCLSLIEKCGSLDYTKNKLKEFREIIAEEISGYGDSISVMEFLEKKMFISHIV